MLNERTFIEVANLPWFVQDFLKGANMDWRMIICDKIWRSQFVKAMYIYLNT